MSFLFVCFSYRRNPYRRCHTPGNAGWKLCSTLLFKPPFWWVAGNVGLHLYWLIDLLIKHVSNVHVQLRCQWKQGIEKQIQVTYTERDNRVKMSASTVDRVTMISLHTVMCLVTVVIYKWHHQHSQLTVAVYLKYHYNTSRKPCKIRPRFN